MNTLRDEIKFVQDQLRQKSNDPNLTIICDNIFDFSLDPNFVEAKEKVELCPRSMVIVKEK